MEIILRENEWAREMIETHNLGKNQQETLRRVARYYKDSGLKTSAVKKKMEEFARSSGSDKTAYQLSEDIDKAVKHASEHPALEIDSVDITQAELGKIEALEGRQTKRLAITLLCLAKYYDIVKASNDHWVCLPDNQIMKMANIKTSLKRQGLLYWTLREAGLIQFSKKVDSLSTRVLFVDSGEPAMRVRDFRNIGYQYLMHIGEPYFVCENCGLTVKQNNPDNRGRQKYCRECAFKIRMKQNIDSVMRIRCTDQT